MRFTDLFAPDDLVLVAVSVAGTLTVFLLVIAAYLAGHHDGSRDPARWRQAALDANARAHRAERLLRERPLRMRSEPRRPTYITPNRPRPPRRPRHQLPPLPIDGLAHWDDLPTTELRAIATKELEPANG